MSHPYIGLVGTARSGKSTVGQHLVRAFGYQTMAFADPMREMAIAINPIISVRTAAGIMSDSERTLRYADLVNAKGYEHAKTFYPEVRRFLQALGTEAGRGVLGEGVWIDAAMRKAALSLGPCVFTDVRFTNEALAVKSSGGVLLRIERDKQLTGARALHQSETELEGIETRYTISNTGHFGDLFKAVNTCLAELGIYPMETNA